MVKQTYPCSMNSETDPGDESVAIRSFPTLLSGSLLLNGVGRRGKGIRSRSVDLRSHSSLSKIL